MRISDWSSDVCSSDLTEEQPIRTGRDGDGRSVRDLPAEDLLGERILHVFLDRPLQRPGPIDRIIALLRQPLDRKSVVKGKSESVSLDFGGSRIIQKKKHKQTYHTNKST